LRRTAQTKADTLLTSAARAISMAGSRTSMSDDSTPPLFPICFLLAIGKYLLVRFD
jgi:hypothetical protein